MISEHNTKESYATTLLQFNEMTDPITRPKSMVKIIEIPDASVSNPQPKGNTDKCLGEFVTPQKLKEIGNVSHLFDLIELKIRVDTTDTSIGNIGAMAPNLRKLNLNNSFMTSIRDMGTNFKNLTTLSMSRCCLKELDAIYCVDNVKELNVAYNEIKDISPLSMLENLQVLDLEGNEIDDVLQVEFLALCSKITNLTLKRNPIETSPSPETNPKDLKFYSYKDVVLSSLPQLIVLDDEKILVHLIDGKPVRRAKPNKDETKFQKDFDLIHTQMKFLGEPEDVQKAENENYCRPKSAAKRVRSANSARPMSSKSITPTPNEEDTSSSLTSGHVMSGNPVRALRRRSKPTPSPECRIKAPLFTPERLSRDKGCPGDMKDVLDELKSWRLSHKSLFESQLPAELSRMTPPSTVAPPHKRYSPTPPSTPKSACSPEVARPHSVSDYRARRYRRLTPGNQRQLQNSPDESSFRPNTALASLLQEDVT